jgi:hypothetical protein
MVPAASSYDLFLSYNSADHRIVEEVAHKLADAGLEGVRHLHHVLAVWTKMDALARRSG